MRAARWHSSNSKEIGVRSGYAQQNLQHHQTDDETDAAAEGWPAADGWSFLLLQQLLEQGLAVIAGSVPGQILVHTRGMSGRILA